MHAASARRCATKPCADAVDQERSKLCSAIVRLSCVPAQVLATTPELSILNDVGKRLLAGKLLEKLKGANASTLTLFAPSNAAIECVSIVSMIQKDQHC